ncbi:MAG: ABC transporter substrate-binding protein, partial [Alphaproteobacteria bacterium]|nr:ABC transporter substrate-binding protein [Alphaproteobacteria bacterium]
QYYQTGGNAGAAPDLEPARELLALAREWRTARAERRREIWQKMLAIHADQQFSIGIVSQVRQPVVVSKRLRNVPENAFYGWSHGAYFGIYRPDQFWVSDAPDEAGGP